MIGFQIKDLRRKKKLTQIQLAELCNISQTYLSQLENDLKEPTLMTLRNICVVLDAKLSITIQPNEHFFTHWHG